MGVIRLRLNADPAVITTSPCLHRLLVSPNFHAYREKLKISICFAHLFDENILTFYPLLPRRWEKINWLSFWNGLLLLGKEEFFSAERGMTSPIAAAVCGVYVVCVCLWR